MHFTIACTAQAELCKTEKQKIEIGRDIKRILRKLANELCKLRGLSSVARNSNPWASEPNLVRRCQ